jgi:hypothetical protein
VGKMGEGSFHVEFLLDTGCFGLVQVLELL